VIFVIVLLGTLHVAPALAVNGSVIYTYDALGRVSTASYDTGVCIIYTQGKRIWKLREFSVRVVKYFAI
jgi:hypothetical protein